MATRAPDSVSSRIVGSHRITFFESGTGPVVVLLHAMFGDYLDWEPALLLLSRRHRAIAVDLPGYCAIQTPTLIMAGAEDRTIPPWVQRKICSILPHTRFELVEDSGHVVYLEKSDIFFGNLKKFMAAKSLDF
jgi:pimeloyl-ACP methyl ester carboxylesterase